LRKLDGLAGKVAHFESSPPPLAPIERVVEIFERFFLHEAELTAELLGELARCGHPRTREAVWLTVTAP
jgi:hypothetical protein